MSQADEIELSRMTRRQALARGAGGLLGAATFGSALASLGGSAAAASGGSTTGTLTLLTYPQWYTEIWHEGDLAHHRRTYHHRPRAAGGPVGSTS